MLIVMAHYPKTGPRNPRPAGCPCRSCWSGVLNLYKRRICSNSNRAMREFLRQGSTKTGEPTPRRGSRGAKRLWFTSPRHAPNRATYGTNTHETPHIWWFLVLGVFFGSSSDSLWPTEKTAIPYPSALRVTYADRLRLGATGGLIRSPRRLGNRSIWNRP